MKLSGFFKDGTGNLSATRLAFLLWSIGVLVVWIVSSIQRNQLEPIDPSVITIIGVLMTGKVVQSFSASDGPAPPGTGTAHVPPRQPAP